jgi:hypothetical protein
MTDLQVPLASRPTRPSDDFSPAAPRLAADVAREHDST